MADKGRVYKRGRTWYVDIVVEGQRKWKSAGPYKRDAERLREEMYAASLNGKGHATLKDVHLSYMAELRAYAKKPASIRQAECHWRHITRILGEQFPANEFDDLARDRLIAGRRRDGVGPATINGTLKYLKAGLRCAVDKGILSEFPKVRLKRLTVTKKKPDVLTPGELDLLLSHAKPPYDAIIAICAYTGLRHNEVLKLQARDVDFETSQIHVRAKKVSPTQEWTPKDHEERSVPMPRELSELLRTRIAPDVNPKSWVFLGYEGTPLGSVNKGIRTVYKEAGLYDPERKPGLHQLRRTFATRTLRKIRNVEVTRQLGGWANLDTVQNYVTALEEDKRAAVEDLYEGRKAD